MSLSDQLCVNLPSPLWFGLLHNSTLHTAQCTLHSEEVGVHQQCGLGCTITAAHCTVKKLVWCGPPASSCTGAADDDGHTGHKVNQTLQFIAASTQLMMLLLTALRPLFG